MSETIHISLGPTANAISSHLVNLYGAAATTSSSNEESLCDPNVTHEISSASDDAYASFGGSKKYLVPRLLMVDTRDSFAPEYVGGLDVVTSWSGPVEVLQRAPVENQVENDEAVERLCKGALTLGQSRFAYSSNNYGHSSNSRHEQWDDDEEEEDECYNEESPEEKRRRLERVDSRNAEMRQQLRDTMEDVWEKTFYHDDRMPQDNTQKESVGNEEHNVQTAPPADENTSCSATQKSEREINWHHYLMPPQSSNYQVPLPFDSYANCSSYNLGYQSNNNFGTWREHYLSESIRKLLERCDQVKGFNLYVDGGRHSDRFINKSKQKFIAGGGMYAGLTTSILEELQDECKSAGRCVVMADSLLDNTLDVANANNGDNSSESIQVQQFQKCLNSGLAFHGLTFNADVFLPVSVEGAHVALCGEKSVSTNRMLFQGSAALALALEASTLSYRLRSGSSNNSISGSHRARLGIQSGFYQGSSSYGDSSEPFASAPSLTYHEFLVCMKSSSDKRRCILELDAMIRPLSFPVDTGLGQGHTPSHNILASLLMNSTIGAPGRSGGSQYLGQLHQRLMKGTSLEQMQMEQDRNYRSSRYSSGRQTGPGEWLQDGEGGGLLESLSGHSHFGRRSDHHHFALSSALRPASSDVNKFSSSNCGTSAFLRPIMESMGLKCRPVVGVGVVVKDSVVNLTEVGSYWNALFRQVKQPTSSEQNQNKVLPSPQKVSSHTPILSTLGNSTRSYPRLHSVSTGFLDSLHSRKNLGYLTRDVMAGIVPEKDDCEEALEYCRELVDVYEPPMGSGLIDGGNENDADGAFFDET